MADENQVTNVVKGFLGKSEAELGKHPKTFLALGMTFLGLIVVKSASGLKKVITNK